MARTVDTYHRARCLANLLSIALEFTVELLSPLAFHLFQFQLVFVTISELALPVACLVKLYIGRLTVELHVLRLLLAYHDWRLEVQVNEDNELLVAGLEEKMLDVREQDVCG